MCGIAGIWRLDGGEVDEHSLIRFTDSLKHRGPDGRGIWRGFVNRSLGFGHRRLAIIDLSERGDQPMHSADGRYTIVFNGEIYNYRELRDELKSIGFSFSSESDTEVILNAWQAWGLEMQFKFNGMWALVIADHQLQTLFASRDRFGVKPFHYMFNGHQFAFASELKAFKSLNGFTVTMNNATATSFLLDPFTVEASDQTLFEGVKRLPGGYYMTIQPEGISVKRWWNTLEHLPKVPQRFDEQAAAFAQLFDDAVALRMRSDVPIGTSLSGGFDSSAIVCTLARLGAKPGFADTSDWQNTFTASFPGAENDETELAKEVMLYSGLKGHFLNVDASEALGKIDEILHDFDDLYLGFPVPPWLIYRELRRNNVVVTLDGHGADETMGAYALFDHAVMATAPALWHWGENKKLMEKVKEFMPHARNNSLLLNHHPQLAWLRRIKKSLKNQKDELVGPATHFFNEDIPLKKSPLVADNDTLPNSWGEDNRTLYRMCHSTLLPTILRNFERLSMAHGIEVRMPFMDYRLITFLFALPDQAKIGYGYTKRVAREAMKGKMPEAIRSSRAKVGFNAPMPDWIQGPLKPWMDEQMAIPTDPILDMNKLREAYKSVTAWDWDNSARFWRYAHYLWYRHNFAV